MLFAPAPLGEPEHRVLDTLEDLRERLRRYLHEPRRWVGSLRRLSLARVIQASNSIEGFDAALDDAAAVAAGEAPLEASDETSRALAGYRDAMTYVLQLATDDDFSYSTQLLKSLHFMMTGYDLRNRPGQWRAGAIYVRDERTGDAVYEGPDIDLVPSLIDELIADLNQPDGSDRLVLAAMAHLNLVMIHPFRDGNGRMARCLQSLVLARNGLLSPVFLSIEEYLGRNTSDYYRVLAEVGRGSWQPAGDTGPWIRFCLTAHLRQARTWHRRVRETERLWNELESVAAHHQLPERTVYVLTDAAQGLRVRNSTYRATLAGSDEEITLQTASRDLTELVRLGLLSARGKGRGRHYVAADPLTDIRQRIRAPRAPLDDVDPFAAA